jgi:hypothetical protein
MATPSLSDAESAPGPLGSAAGLVLQGGLGTATLIGGILLASGRLEKGMGLAIGSLVVNLGFTNLLVLYHDQVQGFVLAFIQWTTLVFALSCRRICQGIPAANSEIEDRVTSRRFSPSEPG